MNLMKKIIILCVLIFTLTVACGKEEVGYGFPLVREDVEKVISEQEMEWEIMDERSDMEGHTLYQFEEDNDDFRYINSYAMDGQKSLTLYLHFSSDITSNETKEFNNEYWSDLFDVAGTLYGNSSDVKKVYREFLNYLSERSFLEDDYGYFTKRIGDTHFRARVYPRTNYNLYSLSCFVEIMNSESYEKSASLPIDAILESLEKEGIKVFEGINVSDVKDIDSNDDKYRLVVQGHLENIREMKAIPEELDVISNYYDLPPFEGDYYTAKLVDDTDSIDVYLLSTSLTPKELKSDRNHHINYLCKERISIIVSSPLIE